MRRIAVALALFLLSAVALAAPPKKVVVLDIDGIIGPALADYFERGMQRAQDAGAEAVVLRMDTPGGLDAAMRDIIAVILAADIPVISYVAPSGARAASAGTYISYASHIAAMAPATHLGAATPVQVGGPGAVPEPSDEGGAEPAPEGTAMERKMVEDAVAYLKGLAELRGRNAEWAERAVREAVSLTASEALQENVIDLVAGTMQELLNAVDGREVELPQRRVALETAGAEIEHLEPDWRTRFLAIITNPNIAYVLMLIGIYGLIFELANPGSLVPGVVGAICLVVALFAFQALPINYAGLALILVGMAFMVAEALVPSFGALGLGGLAAFVLGSVILFDTDTEAFRLSVALIAGFSVASLLIMIGIATMAVRAHGRPVVTGKEGLVGAQGKALEAFSGQGRVLVQGETWRAVSDAPVADQQRVRVISREGLRLRVEPLDSE